MLPSNAKFVADYLWAMNSTYSDYEACSYTFPVLLLKPLAEEKSCTLHTYYQLPLQKVANIAEKFGRNHMLTNLKREYVNKWI